MIRALYSSAAGMKAQETLLDVTANNLANVNTNGFKRSHVDFADLVYFQERQPGAMAGGNSQLPVGLEIGTGARASATTKLFSQGSVEQTGNSTDLAIQGSGFFQVRLPNGELRYTRDGAFHPDSEGNLVTGDGYILVPETNIGTDVDLQSVSISPEGVISVIQNGQSSQVGEIQLARFPNPAGLSSAGGNLLEQTPASGTPITGAPRDPFFGTLLQSYLERSNVQMVTELVSLITAQRAYEVNARAVRAGDEMLSNTSQILR
jgi:flagellar basal-body rod protein FlgG